MNAALPLQRIVHYLQHFDTQPAGVTVPRNHILREIPATRPTYADGTYKYVSEWLVHDYGTWYWLNDNGGEVNVSRVNSGALPVSVPEILQAATMAYRIACVLRGEPIDYAYRLDDDDDRILAEIAKEVTR